MLEDDALTASDPGAIAMLRALLAELSAV